MYAPSSLSQLVEWCSASLQEIAAQPDYWPKYGVKIVEYQAGFLETCLASSINERPQRQRQIYVHSWSGMRRVARNKTIGNEAVRQAISALTAKGPTSRAVNAPMLGGIAGTCDRHPKTVPVLQGKTSDFIAFFTRELLGSRTPQPSHIAHGLDSFFASSAITAELFEKELAPAIEKAMLRSPEVILNGLLPAVIRSLPTTFDLSWTLKKHLLKPLLSAIKSSNVTVKEGCLAAFEAISIRCHDPTVQKDTAEELSKLIKETKPADQRALQSHMLAAIAWRTSSPDSVSSDVAGLVPKEANEQALDAEAKVVRFQVTSSLATAQKPGHALSKAFSSGLTDKKPAIRRIWALQLGDLVWSLKPDVLSSEASLTFIGDCMEKAAKATEDVISNAVAAVQTGSVTVAYVLVAALLTKLKGQNMATFTSLIKSPILRNAQGSDGKQSFLMNHRVYSKIVQGEDALWCIRALGACFESVPESLGDDWGQAMLFMITAASIAPNARQEANNCLKGTCLQHHAKLVPILVDALWHWLRNVSLDVKDTAALSARTGRSRIYQVFRPLCAALRQLGDAADAETRGSVHAQIKRLLVLCREPLIPRAAWIDLCIRSGVDPSNLVKAIPEACIEEATSKAEVRM